MYEDQRSENERLQSVLDAARLRQRNEAQSESARNRDRQPGLSVERLKAQTGALRYQQMSRAERLTALGVDPATSDDLLRQLFGRGNDGKLAADLKKADPHKYRVLREGAIATGTYAN